MLIYASVIGSMTAVAMLVQFFSYRQHNAIAVKTHKAG
jgi:hypothetical protein